YPCPPCVRRLFCGKDRARNPSTDLSSTKSSRRGRNNILRPKIKICRTRSSEHRKSQNGFDTTTDEEWGTTFCEAASCRHLVCRVSTKSLIGHFGFSVL